MKKILIVTMLFSMGALGKIKKTDKKNLPKINISYEDTIMIDQSLERNSKSGKLEKSDVSAITLNLVCLKNNKKKKSAYKCTTIDINTVSR